MHILAISDQVDPRVYSERIRERYAHVDLVLSCGDLPYEYLEYIVSSLNVPLLYVRGNHGRVIEYRSDGGEVSGPAGCIDVHRRVVECKGLLIGGLEGSIAYHRGPRFQYTEREMGRCIWRMLPSLYSNRMRRGRYLDILLAHSPPRGVNDAEDPAHRGFEVFCTFVRKFRPKYLIHGHCHLDNLNVPRVAELEGTHVVNAFSAYEFEVHVE
ncbi:MAG TPA: metallophosphoesterase [bacterium]|nr:metallophosphoesterase [bacterium]HQO36207.1 metallophosphoesterase [bacterium]HQP98261.1 metallophosphoesterase [bacterium]